MKFTASITTLFLVTSSPTTSSLKDDDFVPENYCRTAQKLIATTELDARIEQFRPPNLAGFVSSKPQPHVSGQELVVEQFVGNAKLAPEMQTVMCKMKDAGAIRKYLGTDKAGDDRTCAVINRAVVENAVAQIKQEQPSFTAPNIVYDDWNCLTGSQWTEDAPAVTAYLDDDTGTLHLVGKSLTGLPYWSPIPTPLNGVHYCQTIAAESIRSVLLGATVPPTCGPPPSKKFDIFNVKNEWNCPMKSSSLAGDEL